MSRGKRTMAMEGPMARSRSDEAGFSMMELLVAMVVTTIIGGAIFGIMQIAQTSFRREPEIVDRHQNIRMAMDLIMRDLGDAGVGLVPATDEQATKATFIQIFSPTSNESGGSVNNCAGDPSLTQPGQGACPQSATVAGENTDDLEMISNPNADCPAEKPCGYNGSASNLFMEANGSCVKKADMVLVLMADGTWTIRAIQRTFHNSGGDCENSGTHGAVGFNPNWGPEGVNVTPADLCNDEGIGTAGENTGPNVNCTPVYLTRAELITYHVRDCRDGSGLTCLWRRATSNMAGLDADDEGVLSDFLGGYTMVARGIDDLQVQYAAAATPDTWVDSPPIITPDDGAANNHGARTLKVRVTLSGRTADHRLAGAMQDASGDTPALRSQLVSVSSIRSTLTALGMADGALKWQ